MFFFSSVGGEIFASWNKEAWCVRLSFYPGMAMDAMIHSNEEIGSNASECRKCALVLYEQLVVSWGDISKERATSVSLSLSILGGRESKTWLLALLGTFFYELRLWKISNAIFICSFYQLDRCFILFVCFFVQSSILCSFCCPQHPR